MLTVIGAVRWARGLVHDYGVRGAALHSGGVVAGLAPLIGVGALVANAAVNRL